MPFSSSSRVAAVQAFSSPVWPTPIRRPGCFLAATPVDRSLALGRFLEPAVIELVTHPNTLMEDREQQFPLGLAASCRSCTSIAVTFSSQEALQEPTVANVLLRNSRQKAEAVGSPD